MEKSVLVVGKEVPEVKNFAEGMKACGRKVVASGMENLFWNKCSPVSARNLIMHTANGCDGDFDVVLYFDETFAGSKFLNMDVQTCTQVMSEYVLAFQYLTVELLNYFDSHCGKVAFIYSPYSKSVVNVNPVVKAAGSAFVSFAESSASKFSAKNALLQVLVKAEKENAGFEDDGSLARWLCQYFDELDGLKKKPDSKHVCWVKPGSRAKSGLWSF